MHETANEAARRASGETPCPACQGTAFTLLFRKQGFGFVRCAGCGLVRIDPLPLPALLARTYEHSYGEGLYATFARAEAIRNATAETRLATIRPHVPAGPWLDVGCSNGALLRTAAAAGIDAEGIELSGAAVDAARAQGLRATQASAEDFTPERRYACVTAFDLVEHLIAPGPFLERVSGWLRPGGRFALSVPDIGSLPARLMGRFWYYYAPPFHVHYFDRQTLTLLLRRHGLRPVHVEPAVKVFTVDYALTMVGAFNPLLARAARALALPFPQGLRDRPWHAPIGEILVVAEPATGYGSRS